VHEAAVELAAGQEHLPLSRVQRAGPDDAEDLLAGGAVVRGDGLGRRRHTQPLLVALLLGVVTDYVVFYLSGMRAQLAAGAARRVAARNAAARFTPIVVTAGVIVAAGAGALVVAVSPVFRAFGPGMALAVLIAMVAAVTLTPALLGILGRLALWPHRPWLAEPAPVLHSTRWSRLLARRPSAAVVLLATVAGLVFAALPARHLALGLPLVSSLPPGDSVRQAATAAQTGFAAGIRPRRSWSSRRPGWPRGGCGRGPLRRRGTVQPPPLPPCRSEVPPA
jgi:putative drug exporter of the RND superfamily